MGTPGNPNVDRFGRGVVTPDYSPAGPANTVSFAFDRVPPPSPLYVAKDDQLVFTSATTQTSEVVTFNIRLLQPGGRIEDNQVVLRPTNSRSVVSQVMSLAEGYVLSIGCLASVAYTRGQTFARAFLSRAGQGVGSPAQALFADYVTNQLGTGFPTGRLFSPVEGTGNVTTAQFTNPGFGIDLIVQPALNSRWRIVTMSALFTASATVANRQIAAEVRTAGGILLWRGGDIANITASQAVQVSFTGLIPYVPINPLIHTLPLPPDVILNGQVTIGTIIQTTTLNLQAGDFWQNISLLVEEWLDNC